MKTNLSDTPMKNLDKKILLEASTHLTAAMRAAEWNDSPKAFAEAEYAYNLLGSVVDRHALTDRPLTTPATKWTQN